MTNDTGGYGRCLHEMQGMAITKTATVLFCGGVSLLETTAAKTA